MGIENFHTWLKQTYPNCFMPIRSLTKYDYIYIDVNHILHHSIRSVKSISGFIERINTSLDLIFNNFFATKKIVLAVDGTSPYSKVILQRKRRLQGIKNININKLSPLELTPGTHIMSVIDNCLKNYINNLKNNYHLSKPEIVLLSTSLPDEGEIKIFKDIHQNVVNGKILMDDTHLIIGNDADLIVLAMSCKPLYNINMLIRHLDTLELVSIKKLLDDFANNMNNMNNINNMNNSDVYLNPNLYNNDIRLDFTTVSIMFGNDYLPKLKYVKFEHLWDGYKNALLSITFNNKTENNNDISTLIKNTSFNKPFLIDFMTNVIKQLAPQYKKPDLYEYNEANVINYLEGLLWCLNMYNTGTCSMYDYIYNGDQSPSPNDILYFLIFNTDFCIRVPISNSKPLSSSYYTLLLMPYQAKKLVPKKYHKLMDGKFKYIYEKELCEQCNDYKDRLSAEHIKLRGKPINDELIKENISFISKLLINHTNKKHKRDFDISDIKKIVQYIDF